MCTSRDLAMLQSGERVLIAGLVTVRQAPGTAKGTVFLLIEDEWGFMNVVVHRTLVKRYERDARCRDTPAPCP